MKLRQYLTLCLLMAPLWCASALLADYQQHDTLRTKRSKIQPIKRQSEMQETSRMRSSAYPVEMAVHGRNVSIISKHEQTLPIYTHMGTFYMAMRLSKGTNWLSGLPRGSYFINHQLVTVN